MACEQMRDLILTDYIDGCCEPVRLAQLEEHFKVCRSCRELAEMARGRTVDPFAAAPLEPVAESVWENIRQRVERKSVFSPGNILEDFLSGLKQLLPSPSPVPVMAWSLVILLCVYTGGALLVTKQAAVATAKQEQQVLYLAELTAENGGEINYGTEIEQYFL